MLKLHFSSIALGAVLATGAFMLMSQAGPGVPYGSWGPPKTGVVNVFEAPISIADGGSVVVFTVPPDRWLTVTGISVGIVNDEFYIAEVFGGTTTVKGRAFSKGSQSTTQTYDPAFAPGSPVGWVFRPGSQVVIQKPPGAAGISPYTYNLMGYQTRD